MSAAHPSTPQVVHVPASTPSRVHHTAKVDEPATLTLGTICGRLGFTVTAAFVADTLQVKPALEQRGARYYTEGQFATICRQLVSHCSAMGELYAGETA